jgi:hypothetical protein
MNIFFRKHTCFLTASCFAALLCVSSSMAMAAQATGKIPGEVIDHAHAHGTVLVLVGLNTPWQMESNLKIKSTLSARPSHRSKRMC